MGAWVTMKPDDLTTVFDHYKGKGIGWGEFHFCVSCLEVKQWNRLEWNGMNMWWWETA